MDIDGDKLEQTVLALLYLNSFQEGTGRRAWKGFPWTVMDALHEKGLYLKSGNEKQIRVVIRGGHQALRRIVREAFRRKIGASVLHAARLGPIAGLSWRKVILGDQCKTDHAGSLQNRPCADDSSPNRESLG
jgi:hypothetical protein